MPSYDDLLMQLQSQITRMTDPYEEDRRRLEEQIARMNQPDPDSWFSQTPLGQDLSSAFPGGEIPWEPGPLLAAAGVTKRPPEAEAPELVPSHDPYETAQEESKIGNVERLKDLAKQTQLDELASLVDDMPADKLLRIRAQARAKGRMGSLGYGGEPSEEDYESAASPTGGGFTVAPDSPEIRQRQEDTAAWLADQPIRDASFALTPEQAQRDPRSAALASDRLTRLKAQKSTANIQALMQGIVDSIGDSGGRVPAEEAKKLRLLGLPIPADIIGSSIESGIAFFDDAKRQAGEFLSGIDPMMASLDNPRIKFERLGAMLAEDYRQRIGQGMSADDAITAYRQEMAQLAMSLGLMNMQTMQGMQQSTEVQ